MTTKLHPILDAGYSIAFESEGKLYATESTTVLFRDQAKNNAYVNVSWSFNREQYESFMDDYEQWYMNPLIYTSSENGYYKADLIYDIDELIEYGIAFVKGSVSLDSVNGHTFNVSAVLEVVSKANDSELDQRYVQFYSEQYYHNTDKADQINRYYNDIYAWYNSNIPDNPLYNDIGEFVTDEDGNILAVGA